MLRLLRCSSSSSCFLTFWSFPFSKSSPYFFCCVSSMWVWKRVLFYTDIPLPRYSRTGWLGVKPQGYLPTDISGVCPQPGEQVGEVFSLVQKELYVRRYGLWHSQHLGTCAVSGQWYSKPHCEATDDQSVLFSISGKTFVWVIQTFVLNITTY